MTSIFNEIKLEWDGREYVIPPDQVMKLIASVEGIVTLAELSKASQNQSLPLAKLSQAYEVILNYAGCRVTAEDIYMKMFGGDMQRHAQEAVTTLLVMMIPPKHLQRSAEEVAASKGKKAEATEGQ